MNYFVRKKRKPKKPNVNTKKNYKKPSKPKQLSKQPLPQKLTQLKFNVYRRLQTKKDVKQKRLRSKLRRKSKRLRKLRRKDKG